MLWTILVILLILWLLGLLTGYTMGGVIHTAGHCHHRVSGPTYSGTKNIIAIWTLAGEGEVFGKEGGQQVQKDFAKACYTVRRKGIATNHFTTNLQR